MTLELDAEETKILIELLDSRIGELGPEIRHCRAPEYHDGLKALRESVKSLRRRLSTEPVEAD